MSNHLHDIDKLFRDAINEQGEMPASSVWDEVDKSLDKKNITDIKRKYSLLKKVAAAMLLLLLCTGTYIIVSKHPVDIDTIKKEPAKNIKHTNSNYIPLQKEESETTGKIKNKLFNKSIINKGNTMPVNSNQSLPLTANDNFSEDASKISASLATVKQTQHKKLNIASKQKIFISKAAIGETEAVNNNDIEKEIKANSNLLTGKNETGSLITLTILPGNTIKKITAATFITPFAKLTLNNLSAAGMIANLTVRKNSLSTLKKNTFSITAFYAPNIASFRLENDHHERGYHDDKNKIKNEEQDQNSTTFGLLVDYNLKKHWAIQSGLTITTKTINIRPKKIYADLDNDGNVQYRLNFSSGYAYVSPKAGLLPAVGDSIQTNSSITNLHYASIPLSVKYTYGYKKITFFGMLGTAINFLTKGNIETELADNTFTDKKAATSINGLKSTYLSGTGGIGVEYNLSKQFAITFMPSYNFALTSITQNSNVKSYPNSLSIAGGLHLKF